MAIDTAMDPNGKPIPQPTTTNSPSPTNPPRPQLQPEGPIPGENFTSDTKNYAWHRPPEITDMDTAIEASIKQLSSKTGAYGVLNSLLGGLTVVKAAELFVMSGVSKGKWTPDFAILLAGPVAKMIEIMAKDAEIKYNMGIDDISPPTISFYNAQKKSVSQEQATGAGEALAEQSDTINAPKPKTGFMGGMDEME